MTVYGGSKMREADAQEREGHFQSEGRQLEFRWSTVAILLVTAALSGVLLTTLVTLWARDVGLLAGGWDFCIYRDGGRHALNDVPLYAKPEYCKFEYIYPPFAALFFAPLVWLPDGADKFIWLVINVVLLAVAVMLCFRIQGYRMTRYLAAVSALLAIACAFLEPVRTTLFFGQINLLLMLMVLWDAARGERSRFKGIGIGLAAGIKLTPAYFVLYYLLLRQWRAAGVAFGTFVATVGLGWLVLPNDSWQYWHGKFVDSSPLNKALFHVANQSVRGGIARLTIAVPPPWLWLGADVCVVALSMWIAVRLYRRGESLLAITVAGLSASAVSPFTWSHHWVWLVPMIVYFVHRALSNSWWWLGVAALLAVMGSWAHSLPHDPAPRIGLYLFAPKLVGWQPLENLHLIVYAALLVVAGLVASRSSNTPKTRAYQPRSTRSLQDIRS
ncbi:glycosyltransferase 87 family protein [Mycobacterium sp. 1164966.3]|uniref:glycosyltransferase 87 family protein n=1 Tax=Mycobacterium sp. 1164966.3 TaxID=1856861 RepID=UPI000B2E1E7E|nr:glycosyltransferase 87 family protein [Mycobacterium sp. 1164966.3]